MTRFSVAAVLVVLAASRASAENDCRNVAIRFVPSEDLQIVAWIEDADGNYVDTVFITQTTGLRGLGNRTGIMGINSGPLWPYGSREDVLPIWAHRHGLTFPQVVWQKDDLEPCNLTTTFADSSAETYYFHPMQPDDPDWDAETRASSVFTDKGKFSPTLTSHYPPRADVTRSTSDSVDVLQYAIVNIFDAVSRATPPGNQPYDATYLIPTTLPDGDYTLRVEVSKERDFNATYYESRYPTTQCYWTEYGQPYRGQPSVVYDVRFSVGPADTAATTLDYAGYSDLDGVVHAPDSTITPDTPGSGASRLRVVSDNGNLYRVRVTTHPSGDSIAPSSATEPLVSDVTERSAMLTFVAPGDDDTTGTATRYDIRMLVGYSLDEGSFLSATPLDQVVPVAQGGLQTLSLDELTPNTPYAIGIRAYDECDHASPLLVVRFTTRTAAVDACGCTSTDPRGLGLALAAFAFVVRRRRRAQRRAS